MFLIARDQGDRAVSAVRYIQLCPRLEDTDANIADWQTRAEISLIA